MARACTRMSHHLSRRHVCSCAPVTRQYGGWRGVAYALLVAADPVQRACLSVVNVLYACMYALFVMPAQCALHVVCDLWRRLCMWIGKHNLIIYYLIIIILFPFTVTIASKTMRWAQADSAVMSQPAGVVINVGPPTPSCMHNTDSDSTMGSEFDCLASMFGTWHLQQHEHAARYGTQLRQRMNKQLGPVSSLGSAAKSHLSELEGWFTKHIQVAITKVGSLGRRKYTIFTTTGSGSTLSSESKGFSSSMEEGPTSGYGSAPTLGDLTTTNMQHANYQSTPITRSDLEALTPQVKGWGKQAALSAHAYGAIPTAFNHQQRESGPGTTGMPGPKGHSHMGGWSAHNSSASKTGQAMDGVCRVQQPTGFSSWKSKVKSSFSTMGNALRQQAGRFRLPDLLNRGYNASNQQWSVFTAGPDSAGDLPIWRDRPCNHHRVQSVGSWVAAAISAVTLSLVGRYSASSDDASAHSHWLRC